MIDFIRFLNSKDIAEYLRKTHYEFLPEEAAYVVHEARDIPLSEKHEAYRELIACYPEAVLEKRRGDFETQPLSRFLQELMRLEEEYIAECKTPSPDAVCTYSVYTEDMNGRLSWVEDGFAQTVLYPTYEECFRAASEEEAAKIRIKKRYFGGHESVELELLPDGTVLSVSVSGKEEGVTTAFDWFWIKLPTPFCRGDILCCISPSPREEELFVVLETVSTWGGKELAENGFRDSGNKPNAERKRGELDFKAWDRLISYHKKEGDISDMNVEGYEVKPNGEVFWDTYATYLDFERCRDVPENKKVLLSLSAFMKGELSEDLLLNAYRYHVLNAALSEAKDTFSLYTPEGLASAGLVPKENGAQTEEKPKNPKA